MTGETPEVRSDKRRRKRKRRKRKRRKRRKREKMRETERIKEKRREMREKDVQGQLFSICINSQKYKLNILAEMDLY